MHRWLREPAFEAVYRDARQAAARMAVGHLHGLLAKATETLERSLTCGIPAVELRAAVAIIEQAFRGAELVDLTERLGALEEQTEDRFPCR